MSHNSGKPAKGQIQGKTKPKAKVKPRPSVGEDKRKNVKSDIRKPKSENRDDFETRSRRRDEERARRREARRRKVRRQKITIAVSAVVILAAIVGGIILNLPSVKLFRSLSRGDKYAAQADYANAQSAYESALQIDSTSVEAYRCMADNYVEQGKIIEAEQILYEGWEQTQDEGLLHYYCVELHNEAVAEVNQNNCTLATVDKCIQVLEKEADNEDTLGLMEICYNRLFRVTEEDDTCLMFFDEDVSQDTCSYGEYEQLLRRLITLCQSSPSDRLKSILTKYALIDMPYVRISIPHLEQYAALLENINDEVHDVGIAETLACLDRAKEVEDYFATAFAEFEAGNYAYARDLVVEESYQQIRDDFIEENSGYWEGSIYIPVSREQLALHREEGEVRFFFLDGEDYENKYGIIMVWGTVQEDDGVQRSAISYEPVPEDGEDSRTEYTVQYLYSNVKIGGEYVPQMNYRFDTKVTTEDGITTNAIGDWGGEHEWEIDY